MLKHNEAGEPCALLKLADLLITEYRLPAVAGSGHKLRL